MAHFLAEIHTERFAHYRPRQVLANMTRYERLGLTEYVVNPQSCLDSLAQVPDPLPAKFRRQFTWLMLNDHVLAALCFHLREDVKRCQEHARKALILANEFFFGEWRLTTPNDDGIIDPAWWHATERWVDEFRACLAWGSAMQQWDELKRIAEYPDGTSPVGENGEEEKAYFCSVAKSIQETDRHHTLLRCAAAPFIETAEAVHRDYSDAIVEVLRAVAASRNHRFQLLANAELAFIDHDASALQDAFDRYLAYFAKHDARGNTIIRVSYEGTFYFHRARAAGMPLELSTQFADYVIRLD